MDALSEVLAACRVERAVTARFSLHAPWALRSDGLPGVMLRLARGAPWWLLLDGAAPVQVQAGDLLMLPLGSAHQLASAPGLPATPFAELIARHAEGPRDENPLVFRHGGAGEATQVDSVLLWFSAWSRHAVLQQLPPLIHLRAAEVPWLPRLAAAMEALTEDSLARRPGWRVSAARMGELLAVNLLREHLARTPAHGEGWLRGLGDPAIGRALAALHRAPQRDWRLETLAREAAMSRSRFAERFRAVVGATPIGYLTAHRMALAAEQIEAGRQPLARIAEAAGYESEKVFSRAFRRWAGLPPTAWLRRERARRQALMDFGGADAEEEAGAQPTSRRAAAATAAASMRDSASSTGA